MKYIEITAVNEVRQKCETLLAYITPNSRGMQRFTSKDLQRVSGVYNVRRVLKNKNISAKHLLQIEHAMNALLLQEYEDNYIGAA